MSIRKSRSIGFTLIELLVVIAIIAILAAILFPVFAKVREKARQTTCASNEKQLLLSMLEYTNDYDECFPGSIYPVNGVQTYTWMTAIQPYIKNGNASVGYTERGQIYENGIFSCPSSALAGFPVYSPPSDICPDFWGSNPDGSDANHYAVNQGLITSPADKILLFEVGSNGTYQSSGIGLITAVWAVFNPVPDWGNPANDNRNFINTDPILSDCDTKLGTTDHWEGCDYFPRFRHNGLTNSGFSDGHVKAMHPGDMNWYKNIYNLRTFGAYGSPVFGQGF